MALSHEQDLIAFEFTTEEGLLYCLELLEKERPEMPFDLPGRQSVILPTDESPWLEAKLKKTYHVFSRVPVVSASAVSPERLAQLRAQRGTPTVTAYGDRAWKQVRIAALRKKLGL